MSELRGGGGIWGANHGGSEGITAFGPMLRGAEEARRVARIEQAVAPGGVSEQHARCREAYAPPPPVAASDDFVGGGVTRVEQEVFSGFR